MIEITIEKGKEMESIVEAVARYANEIPNKMCMIDDSGEYTYLEIWNFVKNLAERFRKMNVQRKDRVVVECTQDVRFLIFDLACALCEVIFVPVERKASLLHIKEIVRETKANLIFSETNYEMGEIKISSVHFVSEKICSEFLVDFPRGENTAEILYTTGTTGKSKGIEISHQNNIAVAENIIFGTEMQKDNIELIPLPLSHSHGLRSCYANLLNGSTIIIVNGITNLSKLFYMIEHYSVTSVDLSPSAASVLLQLAKSGMEKFSEQFDYIEIGTAILREDIKEELCKLFPKTRLYNFYGSTESGRSCVLDFNKNRGKKGCIGLPTKNTTILIVDEDRKEIVSSEENPGILAITGFMNMKGYWNCPELTSQVLENGFVYTNDIGYKKDNYIYMLGRKGEVINYKGMKIAPEEIEEVVMNFQGILDCACIPKEDSICGQVPKLFLVVYKKELFDKRKFDIYLKKCLEINKIPKEITIVDSIPRTANGKVKRNQLIMEEKEK